MLCKDDCQHRRINAGEPQFKRRAGEFAVFVGGADAAEIASAGVRVAVPDELTNTGMKTDGFGVESKINKPYRGDHIGLAGGFGGGVKVAGHESGLILRSFVLLVLYPEGRCGKRRSDAAFRDTWNWAGNNGT